MPGSAAKVVISERQQQVLQELAHSRTLNCHLVQRAKIILLAFEKQSNQQIAKAVALGRGQVGLWRRRWQQNFDRLIMIECSEIKASYRRAITELLSDEPRSGSKGKFTPQHIAMILAVACELPEASGRPITHWTHIELADEVTQRGIVDSISPSRVGHYLRQAELKPHKSRYWLTTKEKDPELFKQQVIEVCQCYQQAADLYDQEEQTHTVCVDEMTGIQALERIARTLPMQSGRVERIEFEYKRHGTQTLIGNFHVATGQMTTPTVGETRTEEDFIQHIRQTVQSDPAAAWIFVADNLNTHCSSSLVEYVSEICGLPEPLGEKRQARNSEIDENSTKVFVGSQP